MYPAIDLREGRVVRLVQGDSNLETEYADDPLSVARRWQAAGATWVHVVNLDGAFGEEARANMLALARVLTTGLRVQFGGGLRSFAALHNAFDLGVSRVVLGTAAVENPELVEAALEVFGPDRVAVGIDARKGKVRTHGWQQATALTAVELAQQWASQGVEWIVFTDVSRDGMGSGLNVDATAHLARASGLHVIASGGVASLEDVRRAYQAGLSGVIVGRALYEGQVALGDALRVESVGASMSTYDGQDRVDLHEPCGTGELDVREASGVELAVSCFEEGFSCSQAVLSAYGPQLGLDRELALRVAGVFGGGMGRMGHTCGAVTGAFMVIGLKRGVTEADDEQTKEEAYRLVKEFDHMFRSRNDSIVCRELLGCDIATPEGRSVATQKNLFTTLCPRFVRDAAEILERILES